MFTYTAIYASNLSGERTDLWVVLLNICHTYSLHSSPWMIGGDFNQIVSPTEHSNLAIFAPNSNMLEFRDCLTQLGVFDLRYQGPLHTWSNRQPDSPVAKKLDRLLINCHLLALFPNCYAYFLPPLMSHHNPCLVDLAHKLPKAGTRPFKFFNYLTRHPDFLPLVQALQAPSQQLFDQERTLHDHTNFLRNIEESYFKQKSRINWLKEGDQNTMYFQRIAQTRGSFNSVRSFTLPSGDILVDPLEMSSHAINHFKSILGPVFLPPISLRSPPSWFQDLCPYRCPPERRSAMISVPTSGEITKVLFKLNPNKSSGPDGLTSGFYKAAWNVLGNEVTSSIAHFFSSSFMPASTNFTIFTLVPKFPGASKISDYRPISCLNTLYKVVSRLLVSRLKPILPDLIVPNQTAFVKDRLLVENTVLAGELVNGYHKTKGPKKITIKVDIAKHFDSVSWSFSSTAWRGFLFLHNTFTGCDPVSAQQISQLVITEWSKVISKGKEA
ncbi:unnamed protein product [Microthlaspi erraticum]|uniref:Reverse transcriptase domain-containing protein n=1 Tax=Microthlaspi erraticum TaxID=1685480 RepID=A0A6D2HNF2_9BRAS|nr:unnamed protein product [Microthlaspi erraticum]